MTERKNQAAILTAGAGALWTYRLLVLLGLFVIGGTFAHYGVSWDEPVQAEYGERVLGYFQSGGQDESCNEFLNLYLYGPLFELVSAIAYGPFPSFRFEIRHALSALAGLAILPVLFRFGVALGKPWVGVWAAAALLMMPRFYGHAFINSKDIPFACGIAWSVYWLTMLFVRRRGRWREVFATGTCVGLTVALRPGGWLILLAYYIVIAVVFRLHAGDRDGSWFPIQKKLAVLGLAWLLMIAAWPWALGSPLARPIQAIRNARAFELTVPVLFEGQTHQSDALPRYYLPKYLAITTPMGILGFAMAGMGLALWRLCKRRGTTEQGLVMLAIGIWFWVPVSLCVLTRPNIYDGLRHFLFVLPALAMFFGVAVTFAWEAPRRVSCAGRAKLASTPADDIGRRGSNHGELPPTTKWGLTLFGPRHPRRAWRQGLVLATATAALLHPAAALVRLHPYQMTYFNELVGGLAGAAGNYDTDYWLTSYREAAQWVNARSLGSDLQTQRNDQEEPTEVLIAANEQSRLCAEYYLAPRAKVRLQMQFGSQGPLPNDVDFYIGTYRMHMSENFPATPIVRTIGRDGAVFAVVREQ